MKTTVFVAEYSWDGSVYVEEFSDLEDAKSYVRAVNAAEHNFLAARITGIVWED